MLYFTYIFMTYSMETRSFVTYSAFDVLSSDNIFLNILPLLYIKWNNIDYVNSSKRQTDWVSQPSKLNLRKKPINNNNYSKPIKR